jgi:uncharacterized protein (UPF0335 family)
MSDQAYGVHADELRQFIERYEQLEAEKHDVAESQKELLAELTGRGYDKPAFKALVVLRKKKPDDVAEFEALLEIYKTAVGM